MGLAFDRLIAIDALEAVASEDPLSQIRPASGAIELSAPTIRMALTLLTRRRLAKTLGLVRGADALEGCASVLIGLNAPEQPYALVRREPKPKDELECFGAHVH
jgi:hypothetical protein